MPRPYDRGVVAALRDLVQSLPTNMAWFIGFWLFVGFLIVLEILAPAFQRQPERSYRWPTNFAFGLVNNSLAAIVPLSMISAAAWASRSGVGLLNQVAIPLWVSMGCTLAVYSLTHYVIHVMEHKTPWWWRIHRVHHLDTHLDVSTSQRHHPFELVLDVLILVAVTIVFGLTSWVLIICVAMSQLWTSFHTRTSACRNDWIEFCAGFS